MSKKNGLRIMTVDMMTVVISVIESFIGTGGMMYTLAYTSDNRIFESVKRDLDGTILYAEYK